MILAHIWYLVMTIIKKCSNTEHLVIMIQINIKQQINSVFKSEKMDLELHK